MNKIKERVKPFFCNEHLFAKNIIAAVCLFVKRRIDFICICSKIIWKASHVKGKNYEI